MAFKGVVWERPNTTCGRIVYVYIAIYAGWKPTKISLLLSVYYPVMKLMQGIF